MSVNINRSAVFLLVMVILSIFFQEGCSRNSLIDPTGKRIFRRDSVASVSAPREHYEGAPPASTTLQPPQVVNNAHPATSTPNTAPQVVRGNNQRTTSVVAPGTGTSPSPWESMDLILGPQLQIARPGAEVIFVAGVRDKAGYLRTNQKIEWNINPNSVGHFQRVEKRNWRNLLVGDFVVPTITSDIRATTSTSRVEQRLDRGTPQTDDDIHVKRGETWVTATSTREGMMWVTASAESISEPGNRSKTVKVVWIDASFKIPASTDLHFGTRHSLVTVLRKNTTREAIPGWKVRYEIRGESTATFPDGNKMQEIISDQNGEAKLDIFQSISREEETRVSVQIIRPAEPGTTFTEPVLVEQQDVKIRWIPGKLALNKTVSPLNPAEKTYLVTLSVTNLSDKSLDRVSVLEMPEEGLKLDTAQPAGTEVVEGVQWLLTSLQPQEVRTIQLTYRGDSYGKHRTFSRATSDGLTVEAYADIQVSPGANDTLPPGYSKTVTPPGYPSDPFMEPYAGGMNTSPLSPPSDVPATEKPGASAPAGQPEPELPHSATHVGRARVFPPDDPNSTLSLDIITPAAVLINSECEIFFNVDNRSSTPLSGISLQIAADSGLRNQREGTYMERTLPVLPQGLKGFAFKMSATEPGNQKITITLIREDGSRISRNVTLFVASTQGGLMQAAGNLSGNTGIPSSASANTPDANKNPSGTRQLPENNTETSPGSIPETTSPTREISKDSTSEKKPGSQVDSGVIRESVLTPSRSLGLIIEGRSNVKLGDTVFFTITVENRVHNSIPGVKLICKPSRELLIKNGTVGLQVPENAPAYWMCDLQPAKYHRYQMLCLADEAANAATFHVTVSMPDGTELQKEIHVRIQGENPVETGIFRPSPETSAESTETSSPAQAETSTSPSSASPSSEGLPGGIPSDSTLPDSLLPEGGSSDGLPGGESPSGKILSGVPRLENQSEASENSLLLPELDVNRPAMDSEKAPISAETSAVESETPPLIPAPDVSTPDESPSITGGSASTSSGMTPTVGAILDKMKSSDKQTGPLIVELMDNRNPAKLGVVYNYSLSVTNTAPSPVKDISVMFALPVANLEIQKTIKGPVSWQVDTKNGLVKFSALKALAAGETHIYTVPVKGIKEGVVEISVQVIKDGEKFHPAAPGDMNLSDKELPSGITRKKETRIIL